MSFNCGYYGLAMLDPFLIKFGEDFHEQAQYPISNFS